MPCPSSPPLPLRGPRDRKDTVESRQGAVRGGGGDFFDEDEDPRRSYNRLSPEADLGATYDISPGPRRSRKPSRTRKKSKHKVDDRWTTRPPPRSPTPPKTHSPAPEPVRRGYPYKYVGARVDDHIEEKYRTGRSRSRDHGHRPRDTRHGTDEFHMNCYSTV